MKRLKTAAILAAACLPSGSLLVASPAGATELAIEGKPTAVFFASGPAGLKIEGKAKTVTLVDEGDTLVFTVKVEDVDTGIALRNKHMRQKYVKTDEFPDAILVVPQEGIRLPVEEKETTKGIAKGSFTMHGVAKDVDVIYEVKRKKGRLRVEGSFTTSITDHGIEQPGYLGVTVDPSIIVRASFEAKESAPAEAPADAPAAAATPDPAVTPTGTASEN